MNRHWRPHLEFRIGMARGAGIIVFYPLLFRRHPVDYAGEQVPLATLQPLLKSLNYGPCCAPPHRTILSQRLLSQLGEFPLIFSVPGSCQQSHLAIPISKDKTGSPLKVVEVIVIL